MRVIIIRSKQSLLIGSGERYYKNEYVDPEDAI